ncbi:MAG: 50S ribosomal protein L25 [Candidatus Yonathbacteria bacterium]|nr:50S ribosomal protein L25 [Candidatus Yonathbacteria bacterium]
MLSLKSEARDSKMKPAFLRKQGLVPAVFYGPKAKTTSITIVQKDFRKIWREAGESSIVLLETPAGKVSTLIHDVQFDPVKSEPIHADFYVIEEGKEVEVHVPIEFIGVAPAVKELGAMLIKVLHEVNIKAMPKDLPHNLTVDVSSLATLEDQILVQDIKLPLGVTLLTHGEEVVASVAAARKAEEEEVAAPVDLSAIEVEKKGKKEEEGGEGEAAGASAEAKK